MFFTIFFNKHFRAFVRPIKKMNNLAYQIVDQKSNEKKKKICWRCGWIATLLSRCALVQLILLLLFNHINNHLRPLQVHERLEKGLIYILFSYLITNHICINQHIYKMGVHSCYMHASLTCVNECKQMTLMKFLVWYHKYLYILRN